MDTSSKRKFSLDSKSSSGQYDLRFTRRKFNENYKWCCCGIAAFLLLLLLAATAIYLAYCSLEENENTVITFRANFRVIDGDSFDASLIDTNSTSYRKKSRKYREIINLLIRKSEHNLGFVGSEILALDGVEERGMSVHFKLHYDRSRSNVTTEGLRTLFHRLFNKTATARSHRFNQLTIDPYSLYVGEPGISEPSVLPSVLQVSGTDADNKDGDSASVSTEEPRVCLQSQLEYCNHDNVTSYPNLFQHSSPQQVRDDLVRFREIVDSECYPQGAFSFVCELLQPTCAFEQDEYNTTLFLPCRSQCNDFMTHCGNRLPQDIHSLIVCDNFNVDC